jgi:molecular chaperone GrpE (heat shock protein)
MASNPDLFWFGWFLEVIGILSTLGFVGAGRRSARSAPVSTADLADLQQQCLRLRHELQQQKTQTMADCRDTVFEQLQPLLTSYPTAQKMVDANPDLSAKNLVALLTPLDTLLQHLEVEPIGAAWQQVSYDPQLHQPDTDDLTPGDPVFIRFVGYRQGDRILCPAKVSRSLPQVQKDEG